MNEFNADAMLDGALQDLRTYPAHVNVPIPWQKGKSWTNDGRCGATVALAANQLGIASDDGGKTLKFYYGRHNAGKAQFEVWSRLKTLLVAAPMFYMVLIGYKFHDASAIASLIGLAGSIALIWTFLLRSIHALFAKAIYDAIGNESTGAAWGAVAASIIGVSTLIGGLIGFFGSDAGWNFNFSLPFYNYATSASHNFIADVIEFIIFNGFLYGVAFGLCLVLPMLMELGSVSFVGMMIIYKSVQQSGMPQAVYEQSYLKRIERGEMNAFGLLINAALFLYFASFMAFY